MNAVNDPASYYRDNYPNYAGQNPVKKLHFYRSLVRRYAPQGSRLFELGVGLGMFLETVKDEYECLGCDINLFGVERTRQRTALSTLKVGSLDALAGEPPMDVIVAWDVLEHLPNLRDDLQAIAAHLKPGGHLMAAVPVYDGPLGWLVRRLDRDPTHVTKQSRKFWLNVLSQADLEVREWGGVLRKLVGQRYLHFTAPQIALRYVGTAVYFVARRK